MKQEIETSIKENNLNKNVVFAFDKTLEITSSEYLELINLCNDYKIYILDINNEYNFTYKNVTIINFYQEINNHPEYLMVDNIHLTNKGNVAISNIFNQCINTDNV